jgi:hypothetical protein
VGCIIIKPYLIAKKIVVYFVKRVLHGSHYKFLLKLILKIQKLSYFLEYSAASNKLENFQIQNRIIDMKNKFTPIKHSLTLKRIGSNYDGGYFVYDLFNKESVLISGGLSNNVDFEEALLSVINKAFLIDFSVKDPNLGYKNYNFYKKRISIEKGRNRINLNHIIDRVNTSSVTLKLDIEGDEWACLNNLTESNLNKFEQIVIEFHNNFEIVNDESYKLHKSVLDKLLSNFNLVNSNVNNFGCVTFVSGELYFDVVETTWLRKDLYNKVNKSNNFENNLTKQNNPYYPSIPNSIFLS